MVPGLCCFNMRPFNLNYSIKRPTDKHKQVTVDHSLHLSCCHLYGCLFVDSVALPHATTRGIVEHPITLPLPCSHWLAETVSFPSGCCPQFCFYSYNAIVLPSKSNQEIFFSSPGNWSHLTEIGRHRWPQAGSNDPEFSLIRIILSEGARRQIKLFFLFPVCL